VQSLVLALRQPVDNLPFHLVCETGAAQALQQF